MSAVHTIDPKEFTNRQLYRHLVGTIGPRPIAFASTVNKDGNTNLSPFSFFNVFSADPPTLIFSPVLRGRDGSKKDTLRNVEEVPQVVVNVVNYGMAEQMSLTSAEFPRGVSEFSLAGFTQEASIKVKPPRVAESPASFECLVKKVIYLERDQPSAGVLVVAEVVLMHVKADYLNEDGEVACDRLDLIGRLGGSWYSRASGNALFQIEKPSSAGVLGFDRLPSTVRESKVLTGSELAKLASLEQLPSADILARVATLAKEQGFEKLSEQDLHREAQRWIKAGRIEESLALLVAQTTLF